MIPRGSQKPGYTERLKYAFSDEKKIKQQQEKLKQVQHMVMFMTTCWMYELPKLQKEPLATSSAAQVPMGSFSGFMQQQLPVTIGIRDPNASAEHGVAYEATLTLKPVETQTYMSGGQQSQGNTASGLFGQHQSSAGPREYTRSSEPKSSKSGKQVLENMRRSSYFTTSLLKPPFVVQRYSVSLNTREREKLRSDEAPPGAIPEDRKGKDAQRREDDAGVIPNLLLSKEQASKGVEDILSEVSISLLFIAYAERYSAVVR
jgi:hypothetical protein